MRKIREILRLKAEGFSDRQADESTSFQELMQVEGHALAEIRQLKVPAQVFLSKASINALDKLEGGLWNAAQDSVCTSEYTESALKLTVKAQEAVLAEAQAAIGSIS